MTEQFEIWLIINISRQRLIIKNKWYVLIISKWSSLRVSLAKRNSRSMFVDYNVERILKVVSSFIFHFKEDNLGLGIIEVRPYKLVMRTIHEISCDAY